MGLDQTPSVGTRALIVGAALVSILSGCGPTIGQAPFSVRPDTLQPGDLLGPFDGMVIDTETERPIAGATVVGSWAFESGIGLRGPAGTREATVETAADGRYRIESPNDVPTGGSMRLRRFTLIVYRRGYVGYRSDFKFNGDQRHDFSQHANKVRLEKWQPSFEHREHMAFVGGSQAIAKAIAWEAQPASLENEGVAVPHVAETAGEKAPALERQTLLDASPLLSSEEVKGVTGYAGEFEVGRLLDHVRSDVYDSKHFKAKDKPEAFDVAVRVWASAPAAAEAQFRQLSTELPAPVPTEEIGDKSVRARGGDVLGLAFLLRERGLVVQISCGKSQCTEVGMVLRLAKLVESHIGELKVPVQKVDPPAAEPAPSEEDVEEKP